MTIEKIKSVLSSYTRLLGSRWGSPLRFNPEEEDHSDWLTQLKHTHWMCTKALTFPEDKIGKANRWLGFIQGVLWATGVRTIDEMRADNMPEGAVLEPRSE